MRVIPVMIFGFVAAASLATAQGTNGAGGYGTPQNLSQPYQPSAPVKPMKSMALKDVNNPSDALGSASVEDAKGQSVGQVQRVNTTPKGNVRSVDVHLTALKGSDKIVTIMADKLHYIPAGNMLRAELSQAEIARLPAVPAKSNAQ